MEHWLKNHEGYANMHKIWENLTLQKEFSYWLDHDSIDKWIQSEHVSVQNVLYENYGV